MAYPDGVTSCTVFVQAPISFGGTDETVHLEVSPNVRLVHTVTGRTFADFVEQPAAVSTGSASMTLPHVQAGFQDEAGNTVLSWSYTARIWFEKAGKFKHVPLKAFTLLAGQADVDLSLIPGGPASPATTAPSVPVSSVNGQTGAANTFMELARTPEVLMVGALTRSASGAITSAAVVWPDGTAGVFTGTPSGTFPNALDSYTITHGTSTYTQPTVTRNAAGNITTQPAITLQENP